ncbi:hypothetical protein XELAEV_18044006mg [Xenopus laevis]|uniref:C2 domain-containing protein n=1 Tax=Xenopus laevis TaxID=8355 RepID=A0A974H2V6_XENLA|nr:hypothetical protein XELAEV_18044006mg [Xenopus laevis]
MTINFWIIKFTITFLLAYLNGRSDIPVVYVLACMIVRFYLTPEQERIPARHEEVRQNWKALPILVTVSLGYCLGKVNVHIGYIALGLLVFWWVYCDEDPEEERTHTSNTDRERKEEAVAIGQQEEEKDEPKKETDNQEDPKNKLLAEIWPYFNRYLKNLLIDYYQPRICALSVFLKLFRFLEFDLGEKPPRITAVRIPSVKKQIVLDVDISVEGPIKADVALFKRFLKVGASHIELHGTVRVILAPLVNDMPLFGAVTWYLPERPAVKIRWTGILSRIPGVKKLLNKAAIKYVDYYFVAPAHTSVKLWKEVDVDVLHFKVPKNVIRVHVLEAEDLAPHGIRKMFRPYVVISGAGKKAQTNLAKRNQQPAWNQAYEIIFTDLPHQKIKFGVFYRELGISKIYGSCQLSGETINGENVVDRWLQFQDEIPGRLHVRVETISAVPDAARLQQILRANEISRPIQIKEFSSAILFVDVQKGKDLKLKNSEEIPTARVEMKIRDAKRKTKFRKDTEFPEWKQKFSFPLKDPTDEILEITVKDKVSGPMGAMTIPLSNLITEQGLTMNGWFNLHPTEPHGAVWMKIELGILIPPNP